MSSYSLGLRLGAVIFALIQAWSGLAYSDKPDTGGNLPLGSFGICSYTAAAEKAESLVRKYYANMQKHTRRFLNSDLSPDTNDMLDLPIMDILLGARAGTQWLTGMRV